MLYITKQQVENKMTNNIQFSKPTYEGFNYMYFKKIV